MSRVRWPLLLHCTLDTLSRCSFVIKFIPLGAVIGRWEVGEVRVGWRGSEMVSRRGGGGGGCGSETGRLCNLITLEIRTSDWSH